MPAKPTMFIGSSKEGERIADAIHANLSSDVEVTVWKHLFEPTQGTLEELERAVNRFDFAVFVFSGDDATTIRKETSPTVRDNVVLEAGMFLGKLGRDRVFIIVPSVLQDDKKLHLPTDLVGITTLRYEADRADGNWEAATSTSCTKIKDNTKKFGGLHASKGIVAYGDFVVLQDFSGAYVQVEAGKTGTLKADSHTFDTGDKFNVVSFIGALAGRSVKFGDKIALKSVRNQQFVGVDHNENRKKTVGAWASELKEWETFVIKPINSQRHDGDFVTYGMGFALHASEDKSVESGYVAVKHYDTPRTFWAESKRIEDWDRLMFVEPE